MWRTFAGLNIALFTISSVTSVKTQPGIVCCWLLRLCCPLHTHGQTLLHGWLMQQQLWRSCQHVFMTKASMLKGRQSHFVHAMLVSNDCHAVLVKVVPFLMQTQVQLCCLNIWRYRPTHFFHDSLRPVCASFCFGKVNSTVRKEMSLMLTQADLTCPKPCACQQRLTCTHC